MLHLSTHVLYISRFENKEYGGTLAPRSHYHRALKHLFEELFSDTVDIWCRVKNQEKWKTEHIGTD